MKRCLVFLILLTTLAFFLPACGGGGGGGGGGKVLTPYMFGTTVGNATWGESVLVKLSPDTGAFIGTIGPVGYYVNGLEYDPVSDKLYATTSTNDPIFSDGLIEIDMGTGVATTIGPGGVLINNPTVNSTGELFAWTENGDDLVTVDPATGAATVVGSSGISTRIHGLAFDSNNVLYMINDTMGSINLINSATGIATFTTDIGAIAHHGDFHPETGLYWGLNNDPRIGATDPLRTLIEVDVQTPTPVIIGNYTTVDRLHAVTFYYERANLLANPGFETGDLTGWTTITGGIIAATTATVGPASGSTLAGPTEGTYHVVTDMPGPGNGALLQDFTVPVTDSNITLSFDMFVLDNSGLGPIDNGTLGISTANQIARVDILTAAAGPFDTGGTVVRNLYLNVDGFTPILPYIPYSFDLSADLTPGDTYQLRFAWAANQYMINMGIDNLSIR